MDNLLAILIDWFSSLVATILVLIARFGQYVL